MSPTSRPRPILFASEAAITDAPRIRVVRLAEEKPPPTHRVTFAHSPSCVLRTPPSNRAGDVVVSVRFVWCAASRVE